MGENKNSKTVINTVVPLFPQQQKEVVDELKDPMGLVPVPFVPQQQSQVVGELEHSEVEGELNVPVLLVPEQQSEVGEPKEHMLPFLQPQNEVEKRDLNDSQTNMDLDEFSLNFATPLNNTNVDEEERFDTQNERAQAFLSQIAKRSDKVPEGTHNKPSAKHSTGKSIDTLLISYGRTREGTHYVTKVKDVSGKKAKKKVQLEWSDGSTSKESFVYPYENMTKGVGEQSEC